MNDVWNTNVNDLVAMHALLTEQSVTEAAARVGITQSSMSGTLARLRDLFGDPLLVRVGRRMRPTPLAEALAPTLARGVGALGEVLAGPPRFDPATSEVGLVLAMNDFTELLLLPPLLRRMAAEAPGVGLQVVPWGRMAPHQGLAEGGVDAMTGFLEPGPRLAGIVEAPLFESRFVTIARRGHPRIAEPLTVEAYVAERHIVVTERIGAVGVVDEALARLGLERRLGARVPRFTLVPYVVETTDLIATVDVAIAIHALARADVVAYEPPLPLPRGTLRLVWHRRTDADPARRWLRELIVEVTAALELPALAVG